MKQSQCTRILNMLEEHPEGIHSFELMTKHYILRASERIRELKAQGHNIVSKHEKLGQAWGVRYIKV